MKMPGWQPRQLSPSASAHLDVTRTIAAWAVMWGHLRTLFFVDFQHLPHSGWLLRSIYFFTGFGHQAVMVFFVLSGFLISTSVIKLHFAGTWSWREYAINRSTRLYVVLIPGLLLGMLWDTLGSSLFVYSGVYTNPVPDLGPTIAATNSTAANFFGNLFFLQTIMCPPFGSNTPLWSLANEFWYYALFPIALSAGIAFARKAVRVAIAYSAIAVALAAFLGTEKLSGFLIWMSGCALVIAYSQFQPRSKYSLLFYFFASFFILGGCLVAARTSITTVLGSDLAVGIAFSIFLFGVLQFQRGAGSSHYLGATRRFAGFSYSLYVLHFPLLLFLRAWVVPRERWQPDTRHLLYASLIGASVLGFSWAVSLVTENKTGVARNWLRRMLPATQ